LSKTIDEIRLKYFFDIFCQGSVSQSITAFLESNNYEDAVRKAVSLGGDAVTMACIARGIAEIFMDPSQKTFHWKQERGCQNKFGRSQINSMK